MFASGPLEFLAALSFEEFLLLIVGANVGMYVASIALVRGLQALLPERNLNPESPAAPLRDVALSLLICALNIAVAVPGWMLWKAGVIELREGASSIAFLDAVLLLCYFDFTMYGLHRLMHVGWLFRWIHARHHEHRSVSGLSFYVMSPIEAIGFGALLVGVLCWRSFDVRALLFFLTLNWLYGTLGHSGIGFRNRLLRWVVGDSVFHHRHHAGGDVNFGFFSPIWDRLLRTAG